MSDATLLFVPLIIGVLVLRLVLESMLSMGWRGARRDNSVRLSLSRLTTPLLVAGFLISLVATIVGVRLNVVPFWVLVMLGGLIWILRTNRLLAERGQVVGEGLPPLPNPPPLRRLEQRSGRAQIPGESASGETPSGPPLDSMEQAIGKLPMPLARIGREQPLSSVQADAWFGRQEARLARFLKGKELGAARLRLSTVKSMLLLGQIGVGEADGDVDMVLRRAARG